METKYRWRRLPTDHRGPPAPVRRDLFMNRSVMQDAYTPRPEHHFTFGLWTVGNPGRDPFGEPVRAPIPPTRIVHKPAELGPYGVNLHDNDLVPPDSAASERDRIVREFKAALQATGLRVPMATTNLFSDPAFRDGEIGRASCRERVESQVVPRAEK